MSNELVEKLSEEKFAGKNPEWKEAKWGDIKVLCAWDDKNWYYKNGEVIYVQAKEGPGNSTSHCYGCGTEIEFGAQRQSKWLEEFDGPVGDGSVKLKHIPYCPTCEKEPEETSVIVEEGSLY